MRRYMRRMTKNGHFVKKLLIFADNFSNNWTIQGRSKIWTFCGSDLSGLALAMAIVPTIHPTLLKPQQLRMVYTMVSV